jgi:trehalose 6-phosphate phosphatase
MGLPPVSSEAGRAGLAALLDRPGAALLGLDFDGTLAPIVPDPDAARAHPDVPLRLSRLRPASAGSR